MPQGGRWIANWVGDAIDARGQINPVIAAKARNHDIRRFAIGRVGEVVAHHQLQAFGQQDQQLVTMAVSQRVIDLLEAINVDEHQTMRGSGLADAQALLHEAF